MGNKKRRQPVIDDAGLALVSELVEQRAKADALTQLKINGRMSKTRGVALVHGIDGQAF